MASSMPERAAIGEDKKLECGAESLKKLDGRFQMAKARMVRALDRAIGTRPSKEFGAEAAVSRARNGEIPEWLARVRADRDAWQDFVSEAMESDDGMNTKTVTTIEGVEVTTLVMVRKVG